MLVGCVLTGGDTLVVEVEVVVVGVVVIVDDGKSVYSKQIQTEVLSSKVYESRVTNTSSLYNKHRT